MQARLGFYRSSGALRPPETGAAAHMSLHLNHNVKEPTKTDARSHPIFRGAPWRLRFRCPDQAVRVARPVGGVVIYVATHLRSTLISRFFGRPAFFLAARLQSNSGKAVVDLISCIAKDELTSCSGATLVSLR